MGPKTKKRAKSESAAGPERSITLGSLSHVGMKRSGNEDSYCALVHPNTPRGTELLLAVADGMGGRQAGELASALATQGLVERLSRGSASHPAPTAALAREGLLKEAVREVNAEVLRAASKPSTRGMGTTLTAVLLAGSVLSIAHVGDSRAYLVRDGKLHQITQDHNWVAEEVARGALTPQQGREHPGRNVLTRALGTAPSVDVDSLSLKVNAGDVLMLCSDGLHSLVSDDEIVQVLVGAEPQQACQLLVERANELGGHDNITVVAARIDGLKSGNGVSSSELDLRQMATMELRSPRSPRHKIIRGARVLLFPLWLPLWVLAKLVRLALRRSS